MFHRIPSIEKIAVTIGWRPERDLEAILDDVIAAENRRYAPQFSAASD
jgi:hypothetical protein